jgi:phosphohistidine phosphatase
MKTVIIMRHAKSSWKEAGMADHDRPLNRRGNAAAAQMAELLRSTGPLPDLVLSSTALRASSTARKMAAVTAGDPDPRLLPELYLAGPDAYLQALRHHAASANCVMVVGHNPGLEQLLDQLTDVEQSLPTAAIAVVALPIDDWQELTSQTRGQLQQLWRPREV